MVVEPWCAPTGQYSPIWSVKLLLEFEFSIASSIEISTEPNISSIKTRVIRSEINI